jgi:hypothetical protein
MPDIKISDAAPAGPLLESDLVPIARAGTEAPLNATMADLAAYVTVLASSHPPSMSNQPPTAGKMEEYARADHVHPTDTSRAPIDSPQFTGTPTSPTMLPSDASNALATTKFVHDLAQSGTLRTETPGIDDNSELVATTEFVINQGSTDQPLMDGVPTAGASRRFSRGDHTHPTDSTRAPASAIPAAGDATPAMNGTAATGISKAWSRDDHVHPTDITRAAVTAIPGASSTTPIMDGTAAIGTGTTWARADHVHASDTSRYAASNPSGFQTAAQVATALSPYAPLNSPVLTGNPQAPNPTPSTDADQSIATTYFVRTGIIDGSEPLPGQVGEYLSAQCMSTAAIALTSGVDTSIAVLALGAGDWDLMASIGFTLASNNSTTLKAWINTTGGGAAPPIDQIGGNIVMPVANNTPQVIMPLVPTRVNLTGTTNMRLGVTVTTSGGTISGWGKLMARRRR